MVGREGLKNRKKIMVNIVVWESHLRPGKLEGSLENEGKES